MAKCKACSAEGAWNDGPADCHRCRGTGVEPTACGGGEIRVVNGGQGELCPMPSPCPYCDVRRRDLAALRAVAEEMAYLVEHVHDAPAANDWSNRRATVLKRWREAKH